MHVQELPHVLTHTMSLPATEDWPTMLSTLLRPSALGCLLLRLRRRQRMLLLMLPVVLRPPPGAVSSSELEQLCSTTCHHSKGERSLHSVTQHGRDERT